MTLRIIEKHLICLIQWIKWSQTLFLAASLEKLQNISSNYCGSNQSRLYKELLQENTYFVCKLICKASVGRTRLDFALQIYPTCASSIIKINFYTPFHYTALSLGSWFIAWKVLLYELTITCFNSVKFEYLIEQKLK